MRYIHFDKNRCVGCRNCQLICSGFWQKVFNPLKSNLRVEQDECYGPSSMHICRQEIDAECVKVCPTGALSIEQEKGFVEVGTPFLVEPIDAVGGLGTHNWQTKGWEKAGNISGDRLLADHSLRAWACYACNLGGCTRVVRSNRDPAVMTEGPEYEILFAVGSNCGVDDLDKIIETDRLCDDYGIDTISFGGAIGFVMECFQRGFLTEQNTGGIDFSFGNGDALMASAHLVVKQEGFGKLLGQGVKAMAVEIGQGSDRFAFHIKGLEPPGHSARALKVMGIGYAVSSRGGSHHDARPSLEYRLDREQRRSTKGKVEMAYDTGNWSPCGIP
jgi:aldehyde:ferredoxin oxidoreductase